MGLIHQSANTAGLWIPGVEITSVCPDYIHPLKLQSACFLPTSGGGLSTYTSRQTVPCRGPVRTSEGWSLEASEIRFGGGNLSDSASENSC